jgi:hypothetical protein
VIGSRFTRAAGVEGWVNGAGGVFEGMGAWALMLSTVQPNATAANVAIVHLRAVIGISSLAGFTEAWASFGGVIATAWHRAEGSFSA